MPEWLVVLIMFVVGILLAVAITWLTIWQERSGTMAVAPAPAGGSGPYGPGSAAPLAGGAAPAGFTIKGNADSMLYHSPESPYYGRTVAEVWFRTEADAQKAGFTRWDHKGA